MTLIIHTLESSHEFDGDTYRVNADYLQHKATHLFIASQHWDELICYLTEDIPLGCLKYIREKSDEIVAYFEDSSSKHIMSLLTELYPEKSGALRKQLMLGRDLHEVLR